MAKNSEMRKLSDLPITCTSCKVCPAQGCSTRAHTFEGTSINRRTLIAGGTGVIALTALNPSALAQTTESTAAESTAEVCVSLTPEMTEGPYYIDDLLLRDDITEGKEGVPLALTINVIDAVSCEPMADVAVDIWHCDALGDYSGISGQSGNDDTSGQTYLRGVQLTGEDGAATIQTIYPGWYVGRATHIHLKVHTGGTAEDGTYIGGTTAHTGQLFFDDDTTDAVTQLEPYVQRIGVERTMNSTDNILQGGGADTSAFFVTLTPIDENDLSLGFTGTALLGIDPDAESTQGGSSQPGSGGPGGNNTPPPPGN